MNKKTVLIVQLLLLILYIILGIFVDGSSTYNVVSAMLFAALCIFLSLIRKT